MKMTEERFTAIMAWHEVNSKTETCQMYNSATMQVILTRNIKWNGFDGTNLAIDPTLFDFTDRKYIRKQPFVITQEKRKKMIIN